MSFPAGLHLFLEEDPMVVKNGICYPDDPAAEPMLSVAGCSVVDDTHLRIRFNTGDIRIVDVSPLFAFPALAPLGNPEILRAFSIDHGILNWLDGELDIAPEWLYDHGDPVCRPVAFDLRSLSVAEAPSECDAGRPDSARAPVASPS